MHTVSARKIALALSLASLVISAAGAAAPARTVAGARTFVEAARTQPCSHNACAQRVELNVRCEAGRHLSNVRYFTNAFYPDDLAEPADATANMNSIAWSDFSAAVIKTNDRGEEFATAYYYNLSNRKRFALITADCE